MREIVQGLKFRKQPAGFDANRLASMLEDAYLMQRRPDGHTQKYTFSPSSVGYGHGTCPRYWKFMFSGVNYIDSTDALGIANMSYGTDAHARIQKLFKDAGILIADEIEVKMADPPIRGFVDVMIRWDDDKVVGEIKTTRQEVFLHRQATMKPAGYHLLQILIYMKATGRDKGFLMYENKNTQEFLVIPVTMTEENEKFINESFDWMRETHKAWKSGHLPERPFTRKSKICKNCPLHNFCWDEADDGDVVIPALVVPK